MDKFNLKKYLAEGKLLKENVSDQEYYSYLNDLRDSGATNMFGAGEYLERDFNLEKREAREILARWMSDFKDEQPDAYDFYMKEGTCGYSVDGEGISLREWVGGQLEKKNNAFVDELVPGQGKADTVQGEMLRAINKIAYRWYNDGDEYLRGYGTETAGPAHSYLINSDNPLRQELALIFRKGTNYEDTIKLALKTIVDYIDFLDIDEYIPNTEDMLDYEPEFENEEDGEYDHEDYYDDYDDYDEEGEWNY